MAQQNLNDFDDIEAVCLDIEALIRLLDVWAQKEMMLEVCIISDELKKKVKEIKAILEKQHSGED